MRDIEVIIFEILSQETDITDEVGTRIFPMQVPEKHFDLPLIIFKVDWSENVLSKDRRTKMIDIMVSIYHNDYDKCKTLARSVENSIDQMTEEGYKTIHWRNTNTHNVEGGAFNFDVSFQVITR